MTDTILAKYAHPKGYRINIGSGYYIQEGYIGLDNGIGFNTQLPENGRMPDMMIDLCNEKWPFPDESCFEVYSSHSFEHFSNTEYILQEAHRILKPNHIFKIIVPYANSAEGMYPGHDVFYTEKWFNNNLNVNKLYDIVLTRYDPTEEYKALPTSVRNIFPFELARQFLFNACNQMEIHLRKKSN
jgi:predicted SAM-dependent methyltransferase